MAKKKPAEEHENLERWLVSYADFMTLLFATFVVLYALAQSDVNSFKGIEEALKKAFSQNIFDNQQSILDGANSILNGSDGVVNPLMLEYMSQKYEQASFDELEEEIKNLDEPGISTEINEKGFVIRLNDYAVQYEKGTADLSLKSLEVIDKIAVLIKNKFKIHYIEVEGHTDSDPITNKTRYPSNWELSSARASSVIRYLISKHNFNPSIFIATGLSDTIPIVPNTTAQNKAKNRRVEIIILKNKNKHLSKKNMQEILKETQALQKKEEFEKREASEAIQELTGGDKELLKNVIDLKDSYESEKKRLESLNDKTYIQDGTDGGFGK